MKKFKYFILIALCFLIVSSYNVFADEYDDVTVKVPLLHQYSKTTGGIIYLERTYNVTLGQAFMFNDANAYDSMQFEFDLSSLPSPDLIKSANLYLYTIRQNKPLSITYYNNTGTLPTSFGILGSNNKIQDESVLGLLNNEFDSMIAVTAINSTKPDSTSSDWATPNLVSFDLLTKEEGTPILTFDTEKHIIFKIEYGSNPANTGFYLSGDYRPYIEFVIDKEPERIQAAQALIDSLSPFAADAEITIENIDNIEALLEKVKILEPRLSDSDVKDELQRVSSSVEFKKNIFTISANRQSVNSEDGKNIDLDLNNEVSFADNDLCIKADFDFVNPLEDNELVELNIGNEISVKAKQDGVYMYDEKIANVPDGETSVILRVSTNNELAYVDVFLNTEHIAKKDGLNLEKAQSVSVTNNTEDSVTTNCLTAEICPKGYGDNEYGLVSEFAQKTENNESIETLSDLYKSADVAMDTLGESIYSKLLMDILNDCLSSYSLKAVDLHLHTVDYGSYVLLRDFIQSLENDEIKNDLSNIFSEMEIFFAQQTPEVKNVSIKIQSDYLLEANYGIIDSVGNGKAENGELVVILEWILDGNKVIGTDKTINVSNYKGHKITLRITALNNQDVKGESAESLVYTVPADKNTKLPTSGSGTGGGTRTPVYSVDVPSTNPTVNPNLDESKDAFPDISSHWAKNEITSLKQKGILTGDESGNFNPDNKVTRAEFITMLDRAGKITASDNAVEFSDVNKADWFYDSVYKAASGGIVNGYDGAFNPDTPITRQEMAVILAKIIEINEEADLSTVNDSSIISTWAQDAVGKMYAASLMKGDTNGKFRPLDSLTRAEAATVICRILD